MQQAISKTVKKGAKDTCRNQKLPFLFSEARLGPRDNEGHQLIA